MPATTEKEAKKEKKDSFLKDVRNAAIATVLFVAWIQGHSDRLTEQNKKPVPDVTSSSTPNTCSTPEPLSLGEPVVIYSRSL